MFYFVTQKSPYLKDFYYICNYTRDYNVLIISTIVDRGLRRYIQTGL